ncbi:MAG: hypothetical protein ACPG4X_21530 [Pikeienuella sp.]
MARAYAAKVDRNQPEIIEALRKAGCTVTTLARVGSGCPDLLVGYQGRNHLLEVKDGELPPSGQKLTPWQVDWHRDWRGSSCVVNSIPAALAAVGIIPVKGQIS